MAKKKKEETAVEETQAETTETVEETVETAAPEAVEEKPKKAKKAKAEEKVEAVETKKESHGGNRAQRVGVVTSDKMTKTVVVRVDRLIKHPKYRRYVRRKKQFMAHDEMGAGIGDKVRIVETRPLSARKRWRVVEIVQKAEK